MHTCPHLEILELLVGNWSVVFTGHIKRIRNSKNQQAHRENRTEQASTDKAKTTHSDKYEQCRWKDK